MKPLPRLARRGLFLGGTGLAAAVGLGAVELASARLAPTGIVTGWTLALVIFSLALFGARKAVPFLPLGPASAWLRVHAAGGGVAILLFGLHTGFRFPGGAWERALAAAFLAMSASGLVGLWLSRRLPPRLALRGSEVLYDRIPILRRQLRERGDEIAFDSIRQTGSDVLALYRERLRPFLDGPGDRWAHLAATSRSAHRLVEELRAFERYLDVPGRVRAAELEDLILRKDDLDFQRALQGALRIWPFFHVPLTGVLVVLAVAHGVLAQIFAGGTR